MKKISLMVLVVFCGTLFSQPRIGSFGLLHTQSARTFEQGRLEVHSNMNFFTRVTKLVGTSIDPANFNANNWWLVSGNLAITYGVLDNFDITLIPRVYQDTHYSNEYNLPDDIMLNFKIGSFAFARRHMYGAGMLRFRLPTGEAHNYPFAEYASGAFEYGFAGAFSYYWDPYLPERSFNAHLNLGWWNHNEAGNVVYSARNRELVATKNSSEFQYAVGLSYPTPMFDFRLEANGVAYIEQPDVFVYSRENWMYLTPSIRYKPTSWVSVDLGVDVLLIGKDDETNTDRTTSDWVINFSNPDVNLPNYATWKVQLGLNLTILPLAASPRSAAEIERSEFQKRVDFFQRIVEDRARAEDVQAELQKLIEEREEAERELEQLKRILEEEG